MIKDSNLEESIQHGSDDLPIAVYNGEYMDDYFLRYIHWHDEIEITYFLEGKASIKVDLTSYDVQAGDIVFHRPNSLHFVTDINIYPTRVLTIVFHPKMLYFGESDATYINYISDLYEDRSTLATIISPGSNKYTQMQSAINSINNLLNTKPIAYELNLKASLSMFIAALIQYSQGKNSTTDFISPSTNMTRIKDVLKLIHKDYHRPLRTVELSTLAGYSQSHFMHLFKESTGFSVSNYIIQVRLEEARKALLMSNKSITSIGLDCGFNSDAYFIRCFKTAFATTPLQYRISNQDKISKIDIQ